MNSRPLEHESPPITTNPGLQKCFYLNNGSGTVFRAVASDNRGPRFESSHEQILETLIYCY